MASKSWGWRERREGRKEARFGRAGDSKVRGEGWRRVKFRREAAALLELQLDTNLLTHPPIRE